MSECREREPPIRSSFGSKWSRWYALAVARKTWPRNSSRKAERSGDRNAAGLEEKERAELQRLRKENKQLRSERDILSKAAASFASLEPVALAADFAQNDGTSFRFSNT